MALADHTLECNVQLFNPNGTKFRDFDKMTVAKRLKTGLSTKAFYQYNAALTQLHKSNINHAKYKSAFDAATTDDARLAVHVQHMYGKTDLATGQIDTTKKQLFGGKITPDLTKIQNSFKVLKSDLADLIDDFTAVLDARQYGGISTFPLEGNSDPKWKRIHKGSDSDHITRHFKKYRTHLKTLTNDQLTAENKPVSVEKILKVLQQPVFDPLYRSDNDFNSSPIESQLHQIHKDQKKDYSFKPWSSESLVRDSDDVGQENDASQANVVNQENDANQDSNAEEQESNLIPRDKRQALLAAFGLGYVAKMVYTGVRNYWYPPRHVFTPDSNHKDIVTLTKTVRLFKQSYGEVEGQLGTIYERLSLVENNLFLDNFKIEAALALQEANILVGLLKTKVSHLVKTVESLDRGEIPISLFTRTGVKDQIKTVLEELDNEGYTLAAHDNRVLLSGTANILSKENTLFYNIKIPIQKKDGRMIKIYRLKNRNAVHKNLDAEIRFEKDTVLYDEANKSFLNVRSKQLENCRAYVDTKATKTYSETETDTIFFCDDSETALLEPLDLKVFRKYNAENAHLPDYCLVNLLLQKHKLILKSCMVNVAVRPLESIQEANNQMIFRSDRPLKRTQICKSQGVKRTNLISQEFGPSTSIKIGLTEGCTIKTPYYYLSNPFKHTLPVPMLKTLESPFNFQLVKDLLLYDKEIENINFSEFEAHIKAYNEEFYGQKNSFISDFKRIQKMVKSIKKVPHNDYTLKSISLYIVYAIVAMISIFMFLTGSRALWMRRKVIGQHLLNTLCWPYDQSLGRWCPRKRPEIEVYKAPSSRRNRKSIEEIRQRVDRLDLDTSTLATRLYNTSEN